MQRIGRSIIVMCIPLASGATQAAFPQNALAATDASSRAALLDSTATARARWDAARPLVYRVQIELRCECVLDHAPWVLVHGDSIVRDSVRADQRPTVMSRPGYYTVGGLLAALDSALRDTLVNVAGVRFDPTTGVPLSFFTRRRYLNGRGTTAGWYDVRVLGFEVVRAKLQ